MHMQQRRTTSQDQVVTAAQLKKAGRTDQTLMLRNRRFRPSVSRRQISCALRKVNEYALVGRSLMRLHASDRFSSITVALVGLNP